MLQVVRDEDNSQVSSSEEESAWLSPGHSVIRNNTIIEVLPTLSKW